jgi:hypothetical protein
MSRGEPWQIGGDCVHLGLADPAGLCRAPRGPAPLEIGNQFGSAWIRRFGQEVTQRLFQRFALRPGPRLQPFENPIVDVSNYHLSHTHAPATEIAL